MFKEQTITTPHYIFRLLKLLLSPRTFGALRTLTKSRPSDETSLVHYLETHAAKRPLETAILFEEQTISWGELNQRVNQMAHYFRARGVSYGDSVALNIENRPELVVAIIACMKLGAIAGMVNTSQTYEALAHSIRLIQPSLIVAGSECLDNMSSISDILDEQYKGQLLYIADAGYSGTPKGYDDLAAEIADMPDDNIIPDEVLTLATSCFYIFTSGTTGLPKASITSGLKLFRASTTFGVAVMSLSKRDIYYCALPLYHSTGLFLGLGGCLMSGATFALRRKFSASRFFDDCRKFNATAFVYIGELLRYLLSQPEKADDQNHKVVKIIGNGLRPDIWMAFKERFAIPRIHEFYGASEGNTGFVNIFNFDKTVGWSPGAGKDWAIIAYDVDADEPERGADGYMKKLDIGETGLLVIKITEQNPFDGYTDKQANEKKILRNLFEEGDAWFDSGDLVTLQPHGHIQFADRIGDTFRWQGENVATTEVESVIMRVPEAADAVVYGVQVDGRDGRCGMLYLIPKEKEKIDLDGLAAHMRKNLPAYAVPRFLRIGAQLDITGTFKFQKSKLKREAYDLNNVQDKLYLLGRDEDGFQPLTDELIEKVKSGDVRI